MDGVFVIIGAFEEFLFLNPKNYLPARETFNFNDSYCPLIDLMIFRCKSKKIASVRLVVRASLRAQRGLSSDTTTSTLDGETISKFQKLNLSVLFVLPRNPRPAHQPAALDTNQ